MLSTGALSATFFSSSNVFAFFAIKEALSLISSIKIYGSFISISSSLEILIETTELLKLG